MEEHPASALADLLKVDDPHDWARERAMRSPASPAIRRGRTRATTKWSRSRHGFVHDAHGIACLRIALAGYRLADLLNNLFAAPTAQVIAEAAVSNA